MKKLLRITLIGFVLYTLFNIVKYVTVVFASTTNNILIKGGLQMKKLLSTLLIASLLVTGGDKLFKLAFLTTSAIPL